MMSFPRGDPGECLVCGAAHCTCGGTPETVLVQLPNRDAVAARSAAVARVAAALPAPDRQALGDGTDGRPFSTKTYRGGLKRRRR